MKKPKATGAVAKLINFDAATESYCLRKIKLIDREVGRDATEFQHPIPHATVICVLHTRTGIREFEPPACVGSIARTISVISDLLVGQWCPV